MTKRVNLRVGDTFDCENLIDSDVSDQYFRFVVVAEVTHPNSQTGKPETLLICTKLLASLSSEYVEVFDRKGVHIVEPFSEKLWKRIPKQRR